jgi:hypothetical protein
VRHAKTSITTLLGLSILLLAAFPAPADASGAGDARRPKADVAAVRVPEVIGPITGGSGRPTLVTTNLDLASFGYATEEYVIEGVAAAYAPDGDLAGNGMWRIREAGTAPYATRIVVYRPAEPKRFNGTVVVEWFNVTPGYDVAIEWILSHPLLMRRGYAYVGVSAQAVGVQGGTTITGETAPGGIKAADPARYAPLHHPGDSFSYDIFSQAGLVARGAASVDPLHGLRVRRVLAIGESQSAHRLATYINAVQPIAHVFDGFLVHSRSASSARLSEPPLPVVTMPGTLTIRNDLDVPVLVLQTETDLTLFNSVAARQPDTSRFRLWEMAGTSHVDAYVGLGFADRGDGTLERALLDVAHASHGALNCPQPVNMGVQYAVLRAAIAGLDRWVRDGLAPTKAPRLDVETGPPTAIVRDDVGNARGGLRTPVVDAPRATYRGEADAGPVFCRLYGTTTPFDAPMLARLYPTPSIYVTRFAAATDRAVRAGFLLVPEAKNLKRAAEALASG